MEGAASLLAACAISFTLLCPAPGLFSSIFSDPPHCAFEASAKTCVRHSPAIEASDGACGGDCA